ncbi:unnamed protein product [Rangifer tarandus platyrhynchus]|uniref:Uncharacterized protein n=2 Tax=Rangifer tarandus platyrhynchus TaxID=3082113 RepID=A0AC59YMJ5_RANTA|nr:unnamed protein product [Rangifer tarandus platyrhynchus]
MGCVLAEGFLWHTCAMPSVPDHARGQEKVGISLLTCRWGLGAPSASGKVMFVLTYPLGRQPSGSPACADGVVGLNLGSSPQMFHALSISRELMSCLHFFSLPPSSVEEWEPWSLVSLSCPVQDRRVAKSEDRSAQDPCPLPPSVSSSRQAPVLFGHLWGGLLSQRDPGVSRGGSRHAGTEATGSQCPAEDAPLQATGGRGHGR